MEKSAARKRKKGNGREQGGLGAWRLGGPGVGFGGRMFGRDWVLINN